MNLSKGKEGGDGVVPEGTPSQEVGKALAGASPAVAKLISRFFDMGMPLDRVNAFRQAARSRLSPSEYQEFTRRIDNAVYNLRRSSQALDAYRFRTDLADMPPSEWR
jgi:hypothetical protein